MSSYPKWVSTTLKIVTLVGGLMSYVVYTENRITLLEARDEKVAVKFEKYDAHAWGQEQEQLGLQAVLGILSNRMDTMESNINARLTQIDNNLLNHTHQR